MDKNSLNQVGDSSENIENSWIISKISDFLRNHFWIKVATILTAGLAAGSLTACSGWGWWWKNNTEKIPGDDNTTEVQRSPANITVISPAKSILKEWEKIEATILVSDTKKVSFSIIDKKGNIISEGLLWTSEWQYTISQSTENILLWEYTLIIRAKGEDESEDTDDAELSANIEVVEFKETQITNYNVPESVTIGDNLDISANVDWESEINCSYTISWPSGYISEWVMVNEDDNCTASIDTWSLPSGTYSIVIKATDEAWDTVEEEGSMEVVEANNAPTWENITESAWWQRSFTYDLSSKLNDLDWDEVNAEFIECLVTGWDIVISNCDIVDNVATIEVSSWTWRWEIRYKVKDIKWLYSQEDYKIIINNLDWE